MDCPIIVHGNRYSCNEQYIQSQKCILFGDEEAEIQIMNSSDPKEMKNIGDSVKNYNHRLWIEKCEEIAIKCTKIKFETHEHARRYLLQTGEKKLGEGTRSRKWGVGLHISDPKVTDEKEWCGENLMGKILSQTRSNIRAKQSQEAKDITEEIDMILGGVLPVTKESRNQVGSELGCDGEKTEQTVQSQNCSNDEGGKSDDPVENRDCTMHNKKQCAIVIGDSNTKGLVRDQENLPLNVVLCAKSGRKIEEVETVVNDSGLDPENVSVALMHVGTCNWNTSQGLVTKTI